MGKEISSCSAATTTTTTLVVVNGMMSDDNTVMVATMDCGTQLKLTVAGSTSVDSDAGANTHNSTCCHDDDDNNNKQTRLLEEELEHAKEDAKQTVEVLLKFAEAVRSITRHMKGAMADSSINSSSGDDEESKSADESDDDINNDNFNFSHDDPSLWLESMISSDPCLQGTVFGTDLLRLWDAAHRVRNFARMVSEESSQSTDDILQAQQTAQQAAQRAERAENLARKLYRKNSGLSRQVAKISCEKKVLIREVKRLQQEVVTSRKIEMERLLQQHVVGALLLHESQLKATAARQLQKREEEEAKQDEEDLELIQAEDCEVEEQKQQKHQQQDQDHDDHDLALSEQKESNAKAGEKTDVDVAKEESCNEVACARPEAGEGRNAKTDNSSSDAVSKEATANKNGNTLTSQNQRSAPQKSQQVANPVQASPAKSIGFGSALGFGKFHPFSSPSPPRPAEPNNTPVLKEIKAVESTANKENKLVAANKKNEQSASPAPAAENKDGDVAKKTELNKPVSLSSSHATVKLFPSFAHDSPAPLEKEKPTSSRSVSSDQSSLQSSVGGGGGGENVGSKVFNFLFYPEKIHHYQHNQAPRQQQQQNQQQKPDPRDVSLTNRKKLNPKLQLDDREADEKSLDGTVPTLAATTPSSSCAASRARTLSLGDDPKSDCRDNDKVATESGSNITTQQTVIPNCVSFSDDALSVQSNLNSPAFHPSPKATSPARSTCDINDDTGEAKTADKRDVKLYRDLKVFQSLAIPTSDEIDDYREYQDQQKMLAMTAATATTTV